MISSLFKQNAYGARKNPYESRSPRRLLVFASSASLCLALPCPRYQITPLPGPPFG